MNSSSDRLPDERLAGDTIGPYRIESVLGVGGMGCVYQVVGQDGTTAALKVVKTDLARDTIFRKRFEREARIAQRVSHPNVVAVVDTGDEDGVPYLVQEFVAGGSLQERLERDHRLDLATAVTICSQVAAGLDALCEAGLVHRDVKPGNVLLDERGSARITDFGLAKDSQGSVLTRPGQTLGSMDYIAPEQIRGEQITPAADVYALACMMCECVTGAPPFADRQGMRVLLAHLQDEPADPCAGRDDLPPAAGQAILAGLRKDPAQRPQRAGEFAAMLAAGVGS